MRKMIYILLFFIFFNVYSNDDYLDLRNQSEAVRITHFHDILKSFEGNFRQIYFFTPPESKAEKGSGKAENKIVLNERYLVINSTLDFHKEKVQKTTFIGYDNHSKNYILNEYSNFETFPLTAKGIFSSKDKSLIFEGQYPYSELNPNKFKIIFKYDSLNSYTYYFYEANKNYKEELIMEIRNFKIN